MILETDRLILRMFTPKDISQYATICADSDVMRYIGKGDVLSKEDAWWEIAGFLGHWEIKGYGIWAVEEKHSGELIGRVGFLYPEGWPGFEIGWLLRRESWGKGYATEAARIALEFGRNGKFDEKIISLVYPTNTRSIRVVEKIGGRFDKTITMLNNDVSVYQY